jgi:hypothetical protein
MHQNSPRCFLEVDNDLLRRYSEYVPAPGGFMMGTNLLTSGTTTLIDAECNTLVMTAEAAAREPKENPGKKPSGKPAGKKGKREMLYAVAEQSLSGFLEDEPDLYSVADVRVRYR